MFQKGEWVVIDGAPGVVVRVIGNGLYARYAGSREAWIGYAHELRYASPDETARGKALDGPNQGWPARTNGLAVASPLPPSQTFPRV